MKIEIARNAKFKKCEVQPFIPEFDTVHFTVHCSNISS